MVISPLDVSVLPAQEFLPAASLLVPGHRSHFSGPGLVLLFLFPGQYYEQHLRMLPQRQPTKTLTPELSEIYDLTIFFQTFCSAPPRDISKGEEMMSEQSLCPRILSFSYLAL